MAQESTKKASNESLKQNEAKWTKTLMEAGWNAIPSVIIERQKALGLDAIDMNIIVHLSNYWWKADNLPHPPVSRIADAIQVKPRTVQKRIKAMEAHGILRRIERRKTRFGSDTNLYDFSGLIKEATPYAKEKLVEKAKREKEAEERVARKRPKLTVVT
jgi:DNA-binding MarR family transcriptional regulator